MDTRHYRYYRDCCELWWSSGVLIHYEGLKCCCAARTSELSLLKRTGEGSGWPVSPVTRYKHLPLHTSHHHRRIYMLSNNNNNMNNLGTKMAKNYQRMYGNGKLSKPGREGWCRCEGNMKSTHVFKIWHQLWNIKCAADAETRTASAEMTSGLATGLHLSRDMICNSLLISKYLSDWLINKLYRYQNEFIHYQAAWFNFGKENKNRAWKHLTNKKFCISGAWCC